MQAPGPSVVLLLLFLLFTRSAGAICGSSGIVTFVNRSPRMVELVGSKPLERVPPGRTPNALVGAAEKLVVRTETGRSYSWREYGTQRVMKRSTVRCVNDDNEIYAFDGEAKAAVDRFGRTHMDAARLHFWAVRNGAKLPKMSIKMLGTLEGVGVTVMEKVAMQETIASIPSSLMITSSLAGATIMGEAIRTAFRLRNSDWRFAALSMFLLEERAKVHSFWQPYIAMFPRTVSHLAAAWNSSVTEYLQASPSRFAFEQVRVSYVAEWKQLVSELAEFAIEDIYTVDDFIWARAIVQSRVFRKTGGGTRFTSSMSTLENKRTDICGNVEHVLALVPIADLLNHAQSPNVGWGFNEDEDAFMLEAKRSMMKGDAGFDSYGSFRTNPHFLRLYGFVLPGVRVEFTLTLEADEFVGFERDVVARIAKLGERHGVTPEMASAARNSLLLGTHVPEDTKRNGVKEGAGEDEVVVVENENENEIECDADVEGDCEGLAASLRLREVGTPKAVGAAAVRSVLWGADWAQKTDRNGACYTENGTLSTKTLRSISDVQQASLCQVECLADVSCGSWTWWKSVAGVVRKKRKLCTLRVIQTSSQWGIGTYEDDLTHEPFATSGPKSCADILGVPFHAGVRFPVSGKLMSSKTSGLPIADRLGMWRLSEILRATAPPLVDRDYWASVALVSKFEAILGMYETTLAEDDALLALSADDAAAQGMNSMKRHCIAVRREEKALIHFMLSAMKESVEFREKMGAVRNPLKQVPGTDSVFVWEQLDMLGRSANVKWKKSDSDFRGYISHARLTGEAISYDVSYDDGDKEQKKTRSKITILRESTI